ncbi:MAG TPA: helix-turn-helix transcriptional regulator, partial [Thermodesulfobacteriota bacterium]|nr:helix-turn-helix transcriptional regulator [Thermodesulfobacteriota bacterium]
FDMFSLKEKQIIAFASQGYTNKDIGDKLSIAEGTVKNYLYRIYKKLNIHNKKDLKAYSLKYFD